MLLFDNDITFEPDGTAVIWGRALDGARIKVRVTKAYAERVWHIRHSKDEVRRLMWVHIDELRAAAAKELAVGGQVVTF